MLLYSERARCGTNWKSFLTMHGPLRLWLLNREWRNGVITRKSDGGLKELAGMLLFAGIVVGVAYIARSHDWGGSVLLLLFSIGVAARGLRRYFIAYRIGMATFTFDRLPFILGGKLTGTIKVTDLNALAGVRLGLFCRGEGEYEFDFRASKAILSKDVRYVPGGTEIDVSFDLPAEGHATQPFGVRWEIAITTEPPDDVMLVSFAVPVFGRDAAPYVQATAIAAARRRALDRAISLFR